MGFLNVLLYSRAVVQRETAEQPAAVAVSPTFGVVGCHCAIIFATYTRQNVVFVRVFGVFRVGVGGDEFGHARLPHCGRRRAALSRTFQNVAGGIKAKFPT